jgi:creatinine deaminase
VHNSQAQIDRKMLDLAIKEAEVSAATGGVPVGAVLATGPDVIAVGHNERVQQGDPIAHGEISCLRNAGRQASYGNMTLYTTLSPCPMCSGAVILFQIPRIVVGEARSYAGNLAFLEQNAAEVVLLDDERCVRLMREFQKRHPEVWSEDIGGR